MSTKGAGGENVGGGTGVGGSGSAKEDADMPHRNPAGAAGNPTVNGTIEGMLTPELLYKMNKKIAQLTKVIYGLNTRGEELESQLSALKESEEKMRASNAELQHRAAHFKTKYETETAKIRDIESQAATQAQYWKMECDNLKRRLESESGGLAAAGDARVALAAARDDADQARRREKTIQHELDQARHAINNLKAHHDFIMRERDAQQAMEKEKIVLEWQTRLADVENRYKSQVRRVSDDMEVMAAECDILRRRVQETTSVEDNMKEQILSLTLERDRLAREWEIKSSLIEKDADEERHRFNQQRREMDERIRILLDEKRRDEEEFDARIRLTTQAYEEQVQHLTNRCDHLQQVIREKEEEFEVRLKTKVVEWKSQWDAAEEDLKLEITNLKDENSTLKAEVSSLSGRLERSGVEYENRIQELEEELAEKSNELEVKTRNLKTRLNMVEAESKHEVENRSDLEREVRQEKERTKELQKKYDHLNSRVRIDMENRIQVLLDTERLLREEIHSAQQEVENQRQEKHDLNKKLRENDLEWQEKIEKEVKATEAKLRQRLEKTWLEKLRKSEETAINELEKAKEGHRRVESDLKNELALAKKNEDEARRLNEEFKKKVRQLRQSESEALKKVDELETSIKESKAKHTPPPETHEKELAVQEQRYQKQVDQLTISLAEKQQEVTTLKKQLEDSRAEKNQLKKADHEKKIEDLSRQVREKTTQLEGMKGELQYAKNENDISREKIRRLEVEVREVRERSSSLQGEVQSSKKQVAKMGDLERRISDLEKKLQAAEKERDGLQNTLKGIEAERDEDIKIIQDALDEAAQEREDLIATFEKELQNINKISCNREQQQLEDFEWKLREMEKTHKKKLEEKERMAEERLNVFRKMVESELAESLTKVADDRRIADEQLLENSLHRVKRHVEEEEYRHKVEKMKTELNAEWEDRMRSECLRLKGELDDLHAEEKHLAVESMKVQKEQEMHTLKNSWELRQEEMTKEISTLKDSLTSKDSHYQKELENQRASADRDIWELRKKLQKLDESSYDQKQLMQEKHKEEMDRLRVDYEERLAEMEIRLNACSSPSVTDARLQLEKMYKEQMEHLGEQHKLSMERLREELESEKFQAVEEARVIVAQHHEYVQNTLRTQLTEAVTTNIQYREELEAVRHALSRREEVIRSLEEELAKYRSPQGVRGGGFKSSQFSIASSSDSQSSNSSQGSQDRLSISESVGASSEGQEEAHKSGGGLLGKVFGGSWFGSSKGKESSRRSSSSSADRKAGSSP